MMDYILTGIKKLNFNMTNDTFILYLCIIIIIYTVF